jgi:hypothetical protein
MKRRNRIIVGAVSAITTFALLVAFVGMRHRSHYGGMYHGHCTEQCHWQQAEKQKPANPANPRQTLKTDTGH